MARELKQLGAGGWERLVLDEQNEELARTSQRIRAGYVDELVKPILAETEAGWRVLETGSGWASLTATLALNGRLVTAMDWSREIVAKGLALFESCNVSGEGVCADLFAALPFADRSYDCIWSSGVLEHFDRQNQVRILSESARVARRKVISLVPNSLALAYRLGKWQMERRGSWEFGYEKPERSQRSIFEEAGLVNVRETTADAARTAWFLKVYGEENWSQRAWRRLGQTAPRFLEGVARQGYMLVTVGDVAGR
jgi:cyclopropane fatty-acyl-phospholipid synthase-like methyltransferase